MVGTRVGLGAVAALAWLTSPALQGQSAEVPEPPADLVVTNARIYTADAGRPRAEGLAIKGGRLMFIGSNAEVRALAGNGTAHWDAAGRTIIPGMIDAHAHPALVGTVLRTVDLSGTQTYQEVIARVVERARSLPPGQWIEGRGWDQNDWPTTDLPHHDPLSRAVPAHPVFLWRVDGHAALVNTRALALADITRDTPDPPGGRILKTPDGTPTGVLLEEAAADLVENRIPTPSAAELRQRLLLAAAVANRWGLTGMHDAGVGLDTVAAYRNLAVEGRLPLRMYIMINAADRNLPQLLERGPERASHERLWIGAIKVTADGALGSRGAALLAPYTDDPSTTGLVLASRDSLVRVASLALEHGFQLNVHAIGDRGNRITLDAFERALRQRPTADHRFRIEHAQVLSASDIPRFASLGVIPSMQGSHQTSDMYWAVDRLGYARALGAYAWRDLLDTGVIIANGSDAPVESLNPLVSFHAFVSRQDASDWPPGGWFPAQRTSREEALYSVTLWPAVAAFMEGEVGSLTAGKYADFVVLDQDIMTVPAERILATRVVRTVLGGETVYQTPAD